MTNPPSKRGPLRRRLTLTMALLAIASTLTLSLALRTSDEWIEDFAIEDLLRSQLTFLLQTQALPPAGRASGELRYFRPRLNPGFPIPPAIERLPPGFHQDIGIEGADYHVLVRELAPGDRVYLAYDSRRIEVREWIVLASLFAALFIIGISAVLIARLLAGKLLEPLDWLVTQMRALDADRSGQRLHLPQRESELQVIVEAFNRHIEKLDTVVERERAFAAAASHELRTPLAVIRAAADTLALQTPQEASIGRVQRAALEAQRELDALLALSRVRESPAAETLRLDELLPELAELHLENLRQRPGLSWEITGPVSLHAPRGAVSVIFTNLLRNAVHAAAGGDVRIRLSPDELRIADRGAGVADADLARVFEPGFSSRDGGSGMGLYISRALALRFGWQLGLHNLAEGGAEAVWRFNSVAGSGRS